ncbi:hypothetical protein ACFV2H_04220 [Streptomyces sp. NPDC059629]|uniref:hypothetical protein n=1 Tax=Streptomyces sp. NPDC059629 TaxID=3346889 RepID=UPI0036A48655
MTLDRRRLLGLLGTAGAAPSPHPHYAHRSPPRHRHRHRLLFRRAQTLRKKHAGGAR